MVLWFKSYLLNTFVFSAEQRNAKSTPVFSGNFCRWKQKIELRSSQSTAPKPVFLIFALYFALKARKNLSCLGRQKRFLLWWTGMDSNHRSLWQRIYSPLPLAAREPVHISCKLVELVMGLEPATCWLQISCSANWATPALGCIGNAFLLKKWRSEGGSNPWPPAWQAGILTNWTTGPRCMPWWAFRDSNPGPIGYEPTALTNWAKGP